MTRLLAVTGGRALTMDDRHRVLENWWSPETTLLRAPRDGHVAHASPFCWRPVSITRVALFQLS
ncbi:hypothetical protein BCD48_20695 [Pseudofrankia sp. BMG5.36]|nr:hypothetical protein BCD48_20695 [Pseudofrankia sp. BMG5.36]